MGLIPQRVTGLVVGDALAVLHVQQELAFGAQEDLFDGLAEVGSRYLVGATPGRGESGFVGQVAEVGPDHAGGVASDLVEVDVGAQRDVAGVDL